MAIHDVKVPQLSESVAEATLLQWKKKPGDAVAADEILIEIETDKVVLEVPAPSAGVITEIVKSDGGTVVSGEVIAKIDSEAKASAAGAPAAAKQGTAPVVPAAAAPTPASPITVARPGATIVMPSAAKMI
ncbi:MAG: biotin/lipoyl-containing protein, partial [Burkholderiales bacterium]